MKGEVSSTEGTTTSTSIHGDASHRSVENSHVELIPDGPQLDAQAPEPGRGRAVGEALVVWRGPGQALRLGQQVWQGSLHVAGLLLCLLVQACSREATNSL